MTDYASLVAALRRPRLLVRAARFGMLDYDRRRLARLLPDPAERMGARLLQGLLEAETEAERRRRGDCATYSEARHVELLSALMAEARTRPAPNLPA